MKGAKITGGDKLQKSLARYLKMKKMHVQAGVLEGATYTDGTKVAPIAAIQEFGIGVPALGFLSRTVQEHSSIWTKGFAELMQSMPPEKALGLLGEQMKGDIMLTIQAIGAAGGNSKETIKRKGFDKPGIDTGTMLRSIDYEVIIGESE